MPKPNEPKRRPTFSEILQAVSTYGAAERQWAFRLAGDPTVKHQSLSELSAEASDKYNQVVYLLGEAMGLPVHQIDSDGKDMEGYVQKTNDPGPS